MKSLYAGEPKNPPAECLHHHCLITVKEMKRHECLKKQCRHLVKHEDHPYWAQREQKKQEKKIKRAAFLAQIGGI